MKIKIIDILNKISNGEEPPKKIWFNNNEWRLSGNDYYCDEQREYLFDIFVVTDILNDEVEILETTITYKQDKIEKIGINDDETMIFFDDKYQDIYIGGCSPKDIAFAIKINEIIEVLNER